MKKAKKPGSIVKDGLCSFRPSPPVGELLAAAKEAGEDMTHIINTALLEHGKEVAAQLTEEAMEKKRKFLRFLSGDNTPRP